MEKVEKILNDYYNNYDEDERLIKDKAHRIEYITSTKYIDKYLKRGDRILEIGAGTGRYSISYAKKGFQVDSIELITKNLEILKSKVTEDMNIKAIKGNALDLSMYEDNTFDITLVLGPLYHLYNEVDIKKAITEAIRVTKTRGKIFIAYITDDSVILSYGLKQGNLKRLKQISDDNWNLPKIEEEIFATFKVKDFNNLISNFNVTKLETISTDGIAYILREDVNKLNEEDFNIFLEYHLKNCNREDLIGYGTHILEIIEKEKKI